MDKFASQIPYGGCQKNYISPNYNKFKIALGELATVLGSNANAKKSFEIECIYNFVNLNNFNSTSKVSLYSLL